VWVHVLVMRVTSSQHCVAVRRATGAERVRRAVGVVAGSVRACVCALTVSYAIVSDASTTSRRWLALGRARATTMTTTTMMTRVRLRCRRRLRLHRRCCARCVARACVRTLLSHTHFDVSRHSVAQPFADLVALARQWFSDLPKPVPAGAKVSVVV
jgi:hypothetical protein